MNEKNEAKEAKADISPELVAKAKAGDQAAFAELYELTNPILYRTIHSMVQDENLTWDILQDTYLRAYQSLDKLEADGAFLPWLRRIAVNEAARQMAKHVPLTFSELAGDEEDREPEIPDLSTESQPELALDRKETARLVREIMGELPEQQRLVLGMHYYEDMPIKEIAETLNVAPGTVKAHLSKGRKRVEAMVRALEQHGVMLLAVIVAVVLIGTGFKALHGLFSATSEPNSGGIGAYEVGYDYSDSHQLETEVIQPTEQPQTNMPAMESLQPTEPESDTEIVQNGPCGPNASWTLSANGVLTLSGNGRTESFENDSAEDLRDVVDYIRSRVRKLVVSEGVESVASGMFRNCTELTTAAIQDGVTSIGREAFLGCTALTEITIPGSVTEIGADAFKQCPKLTIYGVADSAAEQYAKENGISFVTVEP